MGEEGDGRGGGKREQKERKEREDVRSKGEKKVYPWTGDRSVIKLNVFTDRRIYIETLKFNTPLYICKHVKKNCGGSTGPMSSPSLWPRLSC